MKMQNDINEFVSVYLTERERYESRDGLGYSIGHTMSLLTPPPSQPGLQTSTVLTMGPQLAQTDTVPVKTSTNHRNTP